MDQPGLGEPDMVLLGLGPFPCFSEAPSPEALIFHPQPVCPCPGLGRGGELCWE